MTVILSAVMATRRVRAGIIGTGFMGRVHCEALRRLGPVDVVEVAAVAGSSLEKARAFAAAQAIPGAQGDYRALLADPSIDVIHVCTPNASHFAIASAALNQERPDELWIGHRNGRKIGTSSCRDRV